MSLTGLSAFFQSHLPILEKYWLSSDKKGYLQNLPNQNDKKLLSLLVNPLPQNHEQLFKELKIPSNVKSEILSSKLLSAIRDAKEETSKQKALQRYVEEYFKDMTFDSPKPVETTSFAGYSDTNQKAESKQDNSKLNLAQSLSKYLQDLIDKNWKNFQTLKEFGIKQLSEQYLLNLHIDNRKWLIDQMDILSTFNDNFVVKLILSYAQQMSAVRKTSFYQEISERTINRLSKSIINLFKQTKTEIMVSPAFARRWFELNYLSQIEEEETFFKKRRTSLAELDARRKTLLTIREELKKVGSHLLKPYENHLFFEILVLDLKRQDPDKQLFYEFLQSLDGMSSFFSQTYRKLVEGKYGRKSLSNYTAINSQKILSVGYPTDKLIGNYVKKLFKKYKDTEQLNKQLCKYIDFNIVNSHYAKSKLDQGQQLPNLHDVLSKGEIEELKKSKEITIVTEKTEKFFKAEDDVVLTLRLKNIKQMRLKMYEMNMEQFYLENPDRNIDETINLQYLNPTYEQLIEIKGFKNSFQVIEQELLVEKIPKKCGFFIVELVGEGITSRAVIRKGAIACFEESNIDGKLLKFYDESGNPIEGLKLWFGDRSQVLTNSEYLIPFLKQSGEVKILAVRDTYVQKFEVYLEQESYSFDVGLIYNHESFIVGKKSKIILHPVLSLGRNNVSVQNMQNIKVTAHLINNQNIKSSQKFENVKFADEKDYILQIPIKSYTKSISIAVQAQVKDLQGKVISLNWNRNIQIELMEGTTNFIDMYLQRRNKGKENVLKIRGLNGQPITNLDTNLTLSLYGTSQNLDTILKTNSKGQLNLGNLNYVESLRASINITNGTVTRTWKFNDQVSEVGFCGQQLIYHEDDEIVIPLPFDWDLTEKNIHQFLTFARITDSKNQDAPANLNSLIKTVQQNSGTYLHFNKLQAGTYNLKFLKIDKIVEIRTIEGKKWPNGAIFNEKQGRVFKINQSPSVLVSLGQLKQEKGQKENTRKISIPINIPSKLKETIDKHSIRVHLIMKNNSDSFDENINQSFLASHFNTVSNLTEQSLSYTESNFYSNKTLSDEQAYVLNRQNQKQFIGNNLEKPRIFLKRIEVRDTTESEEQLSKQGAYLAECHDMFGGGGGGGQRAYLARKCSPHMNHMMMGSPQSYVLMEYNLNSHNNFFASSGHCLLNSRFKENIEITIPSAYSEVVVYLLSDDLAIRKTFFLKAQTEAQSKDLKHPGLKDKSENNGWSMSRQIYKMNKGEKRKISRDSLWSTVSLNNIIQFAQIKGHKLPLWISQWKSYSEAKKLEVYDKEVCHELNVFIKNHDSQFFNKIVKPFIQNKIIKNFVDQCLLGDENALEYSAPHKIQNLNEFQKMLLIEFLVQKGQKQQALEIASSMDLYQKSIKRSFETYKELFDIILNSESGSGRPKPSSNPYNQSMGFGFSPSMQLQSAQMYCAQKMVQRACYDQGFQQCALQAQDDEQQRSSEMQQSSKRHRKRSVRGKQEKKYKPGFKQVEKTKEYTETTYAGMKNSKQSVSLVSQSLFWAHLATHLANGDPSKPFLSEAFLYFSLPIEFTLACCFLSNEHNADYELSNEGDNFIIEANNSFMLFVKQVQELDYADKFGVLINQRFFNPLERYTYEDDGTQIEKLVDEFLVKKPYTLQTIVTNTSGTNLELQLLMDVPSGAIPLMSHEYVQIVNCNISSFSTTSFERHFYFPAEGTHSLYPANASRNNVIIAKAKKMPDLPVKLTPTVNKLESFSDVMRSGSKKEILEYIEKRNIFDSNIFTPYSILWMLKDKEFFEAAIKIFRKRNFYEHNVWSFGIYHKNQECILEYIEANMSQGFGPTEIPIFEYFPYFSRRTHSFMDESKSKIRNVQFRETYKNFIISSLLEGRSTSAQKTAFAYYLLLQDRIDECATVFKTFTEAERKAHELQADYLACYLSMYQDYPNFTTAQTISEKYQLYPISTWQKMFKEIFDTLKEYQEDIQQEEQTLKRPAAEFRTSFVNEGTNVRVTVPSSTRVEVYFYDINLELYFSDYPFSQVQSLSVIKPKESKVFASGEFREEKIAFSEIQHLSNTIVEIYEFKEGVPALKIGSFFWANPKIKVKITQNEGTLQVFYDGKKQTGCYVKVYSSGTKGEKFYRDGYTDITGKFKYALADLEGLSYFSILTITKQGGVISKVVPPSTVGHY